MTDQLTDAELSAAVAEKVAGWTTRLDKGSVEGGFWGEGTRSHTYWIPPADQKATYPLSEYLSPPPFATDANAVLPLLEKFGDVEITREKTDGWQVAIMEIERLEGVTTSGVPAEAWEDTLARAACLALLRCVPPTP